MATESFSHCRSQLGVCVFAYIVDIWCCAYVSQIHMSLYLMYVCACLFLQAIGCWEMYEQIIFHIIFIIFLHTSINLWQHRMCVCVCKYLSLLLLFIYLRTFIATCSICVRIYEQKHTYKYMWINRKSNTCANDHTKCCEGIRNKCMKHLFAKLRVEQHHSHTHTHTHINTYGYCRC